MQRKEVFFFSLIMNFSSTTPTVRDDDNSFLFYQDYNCLSIFVNSSSWSCGPLFPRSCLVLSTSSSCFEFASLLSPITFDALSLPDELSSELNRDCTTCTKTAGGRPGGSQFTVGKFSLVDGLSNLDLFLPSISRKAVVNDF